MFRAAPVKAFTHRYLMYARFSQALNSNSPDIHASTKVRYSVFLSPFLQEAAPRPPASSVSPRFTPLIPSPQAALTSKRNERDDQHECVPRSEVHPYRCKDSLQS